MNVRDSLVMPTFLRSPFSWATFALPTFAVATGVTLFLPEDVRAAEVFSNDTTRLDANIEGIVGVFHSQDGYAQSETAEPGGRDWQEGFAKYGLDASHVLGGDGSLLYANVAWVSSGTFGQGDAAGFTTGDERRTHLENLYIGWKSGALIPALGQDGLDFSVGRQRVQVGDGFIISGDSLNFGDGILGGDLDRGGAYYLAARQSFENTAVLRLGGERGWRGDLMWLDSDNPAQAKAELSVATLEHVSDAGTLGATYIDVLDVDDDYAFLYPDREDSRVYSLRAQGNAGIENLFLAGQYAWQETGSDDHENAWYLEAGWTFAERPWSPGVSYRFSRFSEQYDPLFYGNGRALGTWFQGEVAANYAGPFNTNTRVQQINLTLAPTKSLSLGAMLFDFHMVSQNDGANTDGNEVDLYALWAPSEHWWVMPLLGRYNPDASASSGGIQLGNSDTNYYSQLLVGFNF
ncbi:alginate export family protein [Halomonas sp. WWR20]